MVELTIQGPTYCSVNCWKKELTNCNMKITTYEVPWKIYFITKWLALYDPSMHFRQTQRSNYLKFKALLNHSFFPKSRKSNKEHTLSNKINIIYQSYNSSLLLLSMIKTPYINILFILLISWISKKCNKEHSELLSFKSYAWCHTKNNVNC